MTFVRQRVAMIGFGEAAMAFAEQWRECGPVAARAFDIKTLDPVMADAKREDYRSSGVTGTETLAEAVDGAELLLSLVTADQVLNAARDAADLIKPGVTYLDFNSASPATKSSASRVVEEAGGAYVDVAVMSPVRPCGLATPLLVSGKDAEDAVSRLNGIGFTNARTIAGPAGRASCVKMIRSVMVKGLEALSAECFLAAHAAGVVNEVSNSLSSSWPGVDWTAKADYNFERMMVHGLRRAAELEQAALTLADLGVESDMASAAAEWQRRIGHLGLLPEGGLESKAVAISEQRLQPA